MENTLAHIDYQSMTNKELNLASGKMIGLTDVDIVGWNPTGSENNQAERCLFSKLLEIGLRTCVEIDTKNNVKVISVYESDKDDWCKEIVKINCKDGNIDNINQARVIAFLETGEIYKIANNS